MQCSKLLQYWAYSALQGALVGALIFSPLARAKFSEEAVAVPSEAEVAKVVDAAMAITSPPAELPADLQHVAKRRAADYAKSPRWLRKILDRTVGSYFPVVMDLSKGLPEASLNELASDAEKAFAAMEEDAGSRSLFKNFANEHLKPYFKSLKPQNLMSYIQGRGMAQPLKDQTVETTIIKRVVIYLSQSKDFAKKLLMTVAGPSLKYMSHWQIYVLLGGLAYVIMPELSWTGSVFLLATVWFSFKAGPLAAIFNAMSGFFVRPMTEQAKVLEKRYTYKLEQKINAFFDRINPKTSADNPTGDGTERNDRVRIGDLERDGTDFAGMSPEDQLQNWEDGLKMFVSVAARFGQLLRDTHHHGRDLMMLSWMDEQSVTQLTEIMDSKLVLLQTQTDGVLNPHKTAFLIKDRQDLKIELEARLKVFEDLGDRVWLEPDLEYPAQQDLQRQIQKALNRLGDMGLSPSDSQKLLDIQRRKSKAMMTMVTTLTLGELRAFYHAERNRNMAEPARLIQLTLKRGFGKQDRVKEFEPLIQRHLRNMGLRVTGTMELAETGGIEPSALEKCENLLEGGN